MISKKMEKALNEQIALEGTASFIYLAMAAWCDTQGLEGCTQFMHRQSDEEKMHMLKIYEYLSEVDGVAITPAIAQPNQTYKSVQTMFKTVYEHEKKVTASIHKLISLANKEGDQTTFNFLQWYVSEQREEENLMRSILDKIKLIGEGPHSLYYIDKEIASINAQELAAEGEEGV